MKLSKLPTKRPNTACKNCATEFYVRPSYLENGRGKYCNRTCQGQHLGLYKSGKGYCWDCKKIFPLTSEFFYNNRKTASGFSTECKPCKRKYQQHRNQELLERKRTFIRKLGSKCNQCGISHNNTSFFDVDHIVPVHITKESRHIDFRNLNSNLQILCPNCHRLKTINDKTKWQ